MKTTPKTDLEDVTVVPCGKLAAITPAEPVIKSDPMSPKEPIKASSPFKISDSYRETRNSEMAASNR